MAPAPEKAMLVFNVEQYAGISAELCKSAEMRLGHFEKRRFENQEIYIRLLTPVSGEDCGILASVAPPDDQMLFTLLLAHTLKKEGARRVTAILPYLAYARHDKNKPEESLAAAWLGAIMQASGLDEVITIDVHSERARRLFPIPVRSISPAGLFAEALRRCGLADATIVAPDEGAIGRSEAVLAALGRSERVPYFEKQRTAAGITHAELRGAAGSRVVLIDDMLDTGATLVSASEKLKQSGAREINVMVTHGLFTGARWRKLWELGVGRIFCTDSVPLPPGVDSTRMVRLPIVALLRTEILRTEITIPVSGLS
ncbi:MAG TPA: ribose-phosphate diphosphokinase [Bryobacteraceae bacterium]|nr:ribose-phosphate diphosphokinase [Bryobacteraceae bacterium]